MSPGRHEGVSRDLTVDPSDEGADGALRPRVPASAASKSEPSRARPRPLYVLLAGRGVESDQDRTPRPRAAQPGDRKVPPASTRPTSTRCWSPFTRSTMNQAGGPRRAALAEDGGAAVPGGGPGTLARAYVRVQHSVRLVGPPFRRRPRGLLRRRGPRRCRRRAPASRAPLSEPHPGTRPTAPTPAPPRGRPSSGISSRAATASRLGGVATPLWTRSAMTARAASTSVRNSGSWNWSGSNIPDTYSSRCPSRPAGRGVRWFRGPTPERGSWPTSIAG